MPDHRRRGPRRLLLPFLAPALVAGALVVGPAPAHALSCVEPRTVLEDAAHVFAGRVVDADDGRLLIRVEEVWTGGPVPERTWLRVDLQGWSELARDGEIPDGYSSEESYVFATGEAVVATNPCSMWPRGRVAEHRPQTPQEPEPGESTMPAPPPPPEGGWPAAAVVAGAGAAAVGTVLAVGGAWWVLRRRRRR